MINNTVNGIPLIRALGYFIENPYEEVYLRDFARKLNISPNTSQRFLELFLAEGILIDFRRGNLRYFKANLESNYFRSLKIVFEIRKIEKSGIVKYLKEEGAVSLVVFGSVAKGESDRGSDLDMVCIGIKGKPNVLGYQKKIGREINIHFFSLVDWKKQADKNKAFYQDVISHGIVLIGGLPIV